VSIINEFLSKNTTSATLVRARELKNNQMIKAFQFQDKARRITAKVLGNNLYDISIIFTGKNSIFTTCNCPYNYQGVCKHIVSVLLKFQEEYGDLTIDDIQKPALIPDFQYLTQESIVDIIGDRLDDPQVYRMAYNITLNQYNEGNEITFHVPNNAYSNNHAKVRCTYTTEGMKLDCSCRSEFTYCKHKKAVLLYGIEIKNNPGFYSVLDPEVRRQKKIAYGKTFGIENEDEAAEHISVVNRNGQLVYEFSDTYEGLLPLDDEPYRLAKEQIFQFEKNWLTAEKLLPEPIADPDGQKMGFGIILTFDSEGRRLMEVDGFTAKYNKRGDRLISNFQRLAPEDAVYYYGKEKVILELVSKTRSSTPFSTSIKPEHELQPVLRELILNLDDETHTFFQIGSVWDHNGNIRIRKNNLNVGHLDPNFYSIEYELTMDDTFISLIPVIVCNDERSFFNHIVSRSQLKLPLFWEAGESLYLARDITTLAMMEDLGQQPIKKMKATQAELFVKDFVEPLSEKFVIRTTGKRLKIKTLKLKPMQKKLYISGMGQFVLFRPFVKYREELEVNVLEKGNRVFYDDGQLNEVKRDEQFEQEFGEVVKGLHLNFKRQFPEDFYHLKMDEMTRDNWFFDAFEKLNNADIEVLGLNELKHFRYNPNRASIQTKVTSGQDWFDVQVAVKFGDLNVNLQDVKKAVLKQSRYVKLSDGSLGILPSEWLERFTRMFRHGEVKGQNLRISNRKFLIVDNLFKSIDNEEVIKSLHEKKRKLKAFRSIKKVKVPTAIQAELRHYQKEGLNWLNFLHEFSWGGILADDMGLGKTLQILAFLAGQKSKKPTLIVVPTTLMFNWENEIEKFCPDLKVHFHYGQNREKNNSTFKAKQVVITTYGVVTNDIEWLSEVPFNYVILDESQAIKNPQSMRFKAVCLLRGKNKIVLTGTPIENNTFDLYAQMHFVNPGLLGNMKFFREQYSQPIDRDGDSSKAAELRMMISPFIIRRTKEQVATELPPKTEDVLFCTMEKKQRKVYDAYRNKYRNMLLGKIDEDGLENSKIYVIQGLMKLRQICDSPELLSDEENYGAESIKVNELLRNIEEKTGNHKIVVFSQFVSMLSVIRRELDRDQVTYEYLDGQSSKESRQKSVERFQEDEGCRVFLISLKAGGTGLNLTAADYVFLVDPWWNPAVEEQAIDRTYRIGQDKKVFAYRMICKDTIEEKILNYQKKKKAIASDIIQAEESFVKQLSAEDIKDLFS